MAGSGASSFGRVDGAKEVEGGASERESFLLGEVSLVTVAFASRAGFLDNENRRY